MFCVVMFPILLVAIMASALLLSVVGAALGLIHQGHRRLIWILAACALTWGISLLCMFFASR